MEFFLCVELQPNLFIYFFSTIKETYKAKKSEKKLKIEQTSLNPQVHTNPQN